MMKKKEVLIIAILAIISIIAIFVLKRPVQQNNQVTVAIRHRNEVVQTFHPDEDGLYHIDGSYGSLDVEVKDGKWRLINEICPNHICVQMGWKTPEDIDLIICLPNEIIIEVVEQ